MIRAGDLEVGMIVWRDGIPCRVTDLNPVFGSPYFRCIGVMQQGPNGEAEYAFRIHVNAGIEVEAIDE